MKQLKFGFSKLGLLAVILVMLPNILFLFWSPPNNLLADNEAKLLLFNILENIGRYGLMLAMVFIVNQEGERKSFPLLIIALCFLIAYYICWVAYFLGVTHGLLFVGLAVFPSLFFLLSALMLRNTVAAGFTMLFGTLHILISISNFM